MNKQKIKQKQYNLLTHQTHIPKRYAKTGASDEEKCKLFFKAGNSTMLICKGMTKLASESLALYIERFIKNHNSRLEGRFICPRH